MIEKLIVAVSLRALHFFLCIWVFLLVEMLMKKLIIIVVL